MGTKKENEEIKEKKSKAKNTTKKAEKESKTKNVEKLEKVKKELEIEEKEKREKKETKKHKTEEETKNDVEAILNKAKEKGQITYGELANELVDANPEQIDKVFDAFEELGVDTSVSNCPLRSPEPLLTLFVVLVEIELLAPDILFETILLLELIPEVVFPVTVFDVLLFKSILIAYTGEIKKQNIINKNTNIFSVLDI